eukprot:Pgem_evm1s15722
MDHDEEIAIYDNNEDNHYNQVNEFETNKKNEVGTKVLERNNEYTNVDDNEYAYVEENEVPEVNCEHADADKGLAESSFEQYNNL